MYILNPNEDLLSSWFRCNQLTADYLTRQLVPIIHRNGQDFYFAKTKILLDSLNKLPLWLKVINLFDY